MHSLSNVVESLLYFKIKYDIFNSKYKYLKGDIIMYILYTDESGHTGTDYDNSSQPIFSLSGIAINDKDWYDLNHIIEAEKAQICPELKNNEIHATEIFNPKKDSVFFKNSIEQNLTILERLVDLIVSLKIPIFLSAIDKNKYKDYLSNKLGPGIKIDPYIYSFILLSISYNKFLISKNSTGMIFLDENKNMIDKLDDIYKKLLLDDFECDTNNIIENALFLQSHKSNFIQLSDVCNFYINKYQCITKYNLIQNPQKRAHCLAMYDKLQPLFLDCRDGAILEIINSFFV